MVNPGLRNPIWLGIVALTFILPPGCGVEAVWFSYNGFYGIPLLGYEFEDFDSQWSYSFENSSMYLRPLFNGTAVAGRVLHPQPVRTKDNQTRAVTSFSCSFIFQILVQNGSGGRTGSGLTFMMVPDNSIVSAPGGYMGLLSTNTSENAHTFGVEFDTHMDPEFNDPDDNHIGIDLASMNSTATFKPPTRLAQNRSDVYHQVWIEYSQTLDIYIAEYGQDKPTKPFSTLVNLSLLNETMYIGFSAGVEDGVDNLHTIFAWSFSTEGPAPNISIFQNRTCLGARPPADAAKNGSQLVRIIGIIFGIIVAICTAIAVLCFMFYVLCLNTDQPIRVYLAHTGEDKNFTEQLYEDLKSTWRYKFNRIKVFFDRQSMPLGEDFTENIEQELNRTQVGVVIVSSEFFERPWPMTELVYLVRSKSNDSGVRLLPLFYRLKVGEVRSMLRDGAWDARWSEMASHVDAEECRAAVESLCKENGVNYVYAQRNNDVRYRRDVLKAVAKICNKVEEERRRRNLED